MINIVFFLATANSHPASSPAQRDRNVYPKETTIIMPSVKSSHVAESLPRGLVLVLACILCAVANQADAEIYKWKDATGKVHYGDAPPDNPHLGAKAVQVEVNGYTPTQYNTDLFKSSGKQFPHVTLYATRWCGYCKKARQYFKANHIQYTEFDIEKSATGKQQYDRLGGQGVPLIVVGTSTVRGFDVERFKTLYKGK